MRPRSSQHAMNNLESEHVSGAGAVVLPLHVKKYRLLPLSLRSRSIELSLRRFLTPTHPIFWTLLSIFRSTHFPLTFSGAADSRSINL